MGGLRNIMSGMDKGSVSGALRVRFFMPSPQLAPYISAYYSTEVTLPENALVAEPDTLNTGVVEDYLHPEWANLRIVVSGQINAAIGDHELAQVPPFVASGPTSLASHFQLKQGRYWGIGLLPAGWARFVDAPASLYADRYADVAADPAFAALRVLAQAAEPQGDILSEAARIDEIMLGVLGYTSSHPAEDARILAMHRALLDHEIETVSALAAHVGLSARSLERLAKQAFGFPPKLLLRRQRFLRSLAQFMLEPSLRWLNTLDWQYHDQAHFTRDFRRFMTMSPRQYARLDHPVLHAAAFARAELLGEAVQGLHRPAGHSD